MPSKSSDVSFDAQSPKQETVTTVKTVTTDVETTSIVSTTTNANKYTWMKISEDDKANKQEKKTRTKSCSSILDDKLDIIEKLAVFRKSFDNVQIFQDAGLTLLRESESGSSCKSIQR